MFKRNLQYFKGYLHIRISGNSVERFINLCANKNIYLWNLVAGINSYDANIRLADFKKLKPIVRKTNTKVIITERIGFPFFIAKYKFRRLFFIGIILCISLILYFSTLIWNINFQGNFTNSTEELIYFLKQNEVYVGKSKKNINCSKLESEIRKKYDNITWVSVSIKGTRLIINIKENNDYPSKFIDSAAITPAPYDILSNTDCKITSIVTRNGIPLVQVGDNVKKGDILISGNIPVYNDQKEILYYKPCNADADIIGQFTIPYNDTLSLIHASKKTNNIYKHEYFIQFGKYRFMLGGIKNNYNSFILHTNIYRIGDISYGKRSVFPYKKENREYTENEIREILSSNYNYYCSELKKNGVVILQNNVKIYTWSDKAQAKGTLLINMPVGYKNKSTIKEIGDSINGNDGNDN